MKINEAMDELNEIIPPLEPEVTNVRSEPELRVVSDLDALVYGGESINHEGLCAWWRVYPRGIYVLWIDSKIVGALGVWPIKKATYNRIINGEIDEVDITAQDISRRVAGRTYSYWYVADIVLQKRYRDKPERWALFLLEEAIRQWLGEGKLGTEVQLCALGFKPEGITLLEKFKFLPAGQNPVKSPTDKPVYQRTVEIKDIQQVLDHLTAVRSGAEEYDVFISYRRKSASAVAQLIQRELENENFKVFLDVDDLGQGRFDEALHKNIENTPHFIPILSRGCFNPRPDEDDYFRQEIALAVRKKRKIIPIIMEDFEFPRKSALPANIRLALKENPVSYTHVYSKAMIEKIIYFIRS